MARILRQKPVWSDSTDPAQQALWSDGYVRWSIAGHVAGVVPVQIGVRAVQPVGSQFDIRDLNESEMC